MNRRISIKIVFLSVLFTVMTNAQIYVSPTGNDTINSGTIDQPFGTITKAVSVAVPGDTIFVRGGTYIYPTTLPGTISISKSGTSSSRYYLFAYPGERPLLDFSAMAVSSSNYGFKFNGSYWHVKGLDIKGAGDNGMSLRGSYNIIEFCSFFENRDTGLQLSNGAMENQIINCDSYFNIDPGEGNADGFAPKLDVSTGNYLYGCRAWQNSDDGYDGYLRPANNITTTYENCWAFRNGYRKDGTPSIGNGNGFKMGGSDDKTLMHNVIMKNCLAFDNRVRGFDQNNNRGSMILYNNTAYRNGQNYGMSGIVYTDSGKVMKLINCVALGSTGSIWSGAIQQTNSWMPPFVVTSEDFISIDTAGVRGPRKADGSLPDLPFMKLTAGSDLIDAGTNVGLPYLGNGPDLGAFEYDPSNSVVQDASTPLKFYLLQNYPNPFNPSTTIQIGLPSRSRVRLYVYDQLGRLVSEVASGVFDEGFHTFVWSGITNASIQAGSGVYFCKIEASSIVGSSKYSDVRKMILMK